MSAVRGRLPGLAAWAAAVLAPILVAVPPAAAASPGASACGAPALAYRVAGSWPHREEAFTQGLVLDAGELVEGTGRYGHSSVARLDPETGAVLAKHPLPARYFGEGVTVLGERIWQLTWKAGRAFTYDRETLAALGEHAYAGEGWGLTHDGRHLIMSDGSDVLQRRDPRSFELVARIPVRTAGRPVRRLNALELAEGSLYANVWLTDCIARIAPATGTVTGWIDLSRLRARMPPLPAAAVANGIAWDAERRLLVVTGKLWPRLFLLDLAAAAPPD